jgi:hypothetical protein
MEHKTSRKWQVLVSIIVAAIFVFCIVEPEYALILAKGMLKSLQYGLQCAIMLM